jgi:c(7)-type cytochrome triheme protein
MSRREARGAPVIKTQVQVEKVKYKKLKRSLVGVSVALCVLVLGAAKRSTPIVIANADYSKFSHSTPREHADLMDRKNCGSCHRRGDGTTPAFPLHKDCTGCHTVQFTAANRGSEVNPICTICHTSEGLNSSNPPTRKFSSLRSFRAEFDHFQHLEEKANAKPSGGCASCHSSARNGVAQSILAGLNAHQNCYECHSPGKQASDLSSCGVCHSLGAYSPTSTNAASYRVSFSHADHTGRTRLACTACHNVKAQGSPQGRQVSSISGVQHFPKGAQSCAMCHNGRRSFGDADTHDCKRCHKREGFKM